MIGNDTFVEESCSGYYFIVSIQVIGGNSSKVIGQRQISK